MHFFLVNDDGIGAKGIMKLLEAAVSRGHEVTMVAPKVQQSGKSHCFTLKDPMFLADFPQPYENCRAYSLTGSPADCVRVGLRCLIEKPVDALISGINYGWNAGIAAQYSGTVAAGMEGVFHNIPSIAVSIHESAKDEQWCAIADYAIQKAEKLSHIALPHCTLLNINAPARPWIGEKYCPLGEAYFQDHYIRRESPRMGSYFWLDLDGSQDPSIPGTDDDYLEKGYLTLTLIGNFHSHGEEEYRKLNL